MFKYHISFLSYLLFNNLLNAQVAPLIKTKWGQNCYYNDFLPDLKNDDACNKTYAGCYAVAWAQILNYYKFPIKPNGRLVENTFFSNHKINLNLVTYNYDLFTEKIKIKNSEAAKLIYHIGIVANTKWDNSNSLTNFDVSPIITYFKYSSKIKEIDLRNLSKKEKIAIIKNELDNKRPIFAKNAFHYYIIDGYNEKNQLHFNFGWNGQFNGFYDIENCIILPGNLNPTQIMINIEPNYDVNKKIP